MNASSTKTSSKTNWDKVVSQTDDEIDFSDSPELTGSFMASAVRESALITLEIEPDVLEWFRAQGDDAPNRIRAALRLYAQAHQ